jgi:hypothetical protein
MLPGLVIEPIVLIDELPAPGLPSVNMLRVFVPLTALCPFTIAETGVPLASFAHISRVKSPVPTALFELFRLMYDAVDELLKQTLPTVLPVALATTDGVAIKTTNEKSNARETVTDVLFCEFFETNIIFLPINSVSK